jgi:hypothetical protein
MSSAQTTDWIALSNMSASLSMVGIITETFLEIRLIET